MRAQFLAFTFLATAVASGALAQQPAPAAKTFMNNKEIMGLIDKAKADRKGDAPLVAEPILSLTPYRAQLEYRPGKRRGVDGRARRHGQHRDGRQARQ